MTPKKCMSIAKSLTNTQRMELEPLCTVPLKLFSCQYCSLQTAQQFVIHLFPELRVFWFLEKMCYEKISLVGLY